MSLALPEATHELLREAHEKLDEQLRHATMHEFFHSLIDEIVQSAHNIAMATAGQRIVTIDEIAGIVGIDAHTVRKRIKQADPPIVPVKMVMNAALFTLEDIPRIAAFHANEILASGKNVLYALSDIRKAVNKAAKKNVQARLNREPHVKYADWGVKRRNKLPEKVVIELPQHIADELRAAIQQDGVFQDLSHMVRAITYVWLEQRWEKK